DEVATATEPAAVTRRPARARADADRVVDAGALAGLAALDAALAAGNVRERVLRVALHLAVVFAVGRLVVVRLLGAGAEDVRLVGRGLRARNARAVGDAARPVGHLDLGDLRRLHRDRDGGLAVLAVDRGERDEAEAREDEDVEGDRDEEPRRLLDRRVEHL